ncbi:MAG: aminotransferase class I/II-fold pyridoxal phosphate-dependent enzyme [Sphingomonadales bacterium]|nr:aminotransferase class I/II-fold pyridoxal phosphate-dependent enzyme [Sphingomonadales bacterium]
MWKGIQEEESVFTIMSAMARQYNAINLAQGFPNFEPDIGLTAALSKMVSYSVHQYAPMAGLTILRTALAEKVAVYYGSVWDAEREITISAGATQAIYTALQACVKEGDEVIIIDPAYDSYRPGVLMAGARPIHVPLTYNYGSFHWDWDAVRAAITSQTKLIIINQPHNPAGIFLSDNDWQEIENLVVENDLLLLCDEVYEHMVFDGKAFISSCTRSAIRDRLFCVVSFGKTYHNTGWKVGYVLAQEDWTRRFRQVHQFVVFSVNSVAQHVFSQFLSTDDSYRYLSNFYQRKRDKFLQAMENTRFSMLPSRSTYFQLADYSRISDEGDVDFCQRLIREWGVAAIPLSPFMQKPLEARLVRFCFAKTDDVLYEAANRLSLC